jgi:homoserine/homoserine lactone efflux protein
MSVELFLAFIGAHVMMSLTPGPAVLMVSSQGMARGFRAGLAASLGILAGNSIYFALSAIGLGAVLATSAFLFTCIKWAGAAYLVWMGIRTLRNARRVAEQTAPGPVPISEHGFVQGLVKQLANPKSILFFGALLPQFITPGETQIWHFGFMLAALHVTELPILAAYAWLGAKGGAFARGPSGVLWREQIAGVAQIMVGGVIATIKRST